MALQALALLPHSPLLIPEIGRSNYDFLAKTTAAYEEIAGHFQKKAVDTLIIISPHGLKGGSNFVLSVSPEMRPDFKDFGFIPSLAPLKGDSILADQIKNALRPDFPVQLASPDILDNGSGIPLYLLQKFLPEAKALVIHPAEDKNPAELAAFGTGLRGVISQRHKKIAVIVSGDLSHRLKKKSPGGYSPKGAKFDNKLIELLSLGPAAGQKILNMDQKLIAEAGECAFRPLALALGILEGLNWEAEILAYQTDFGIGYLSVNFNIKKSSNPANSDPESAL